MAIIFVAKKEHHKRKCQWETLEPGQYNKRESEVKTNKFIAIKSH